LHYRRCGRSQYDGFRHVQDHASNLAAPLDIEADCSANASDCRAKRITDGYGGAIDPGDDVARADASSIRSTIGEYSLDD
jgi:hypothetical protein